MFNVFNTRFVTKNSKFNGLPTTKLRFNSINE